MVNDEKPESVDQLLGQLYDAELTLSLFWFDLFRRFPMVEDSEWYYLNGLKYVSDAELTLEARKELTDNYQKMVVVMGEDLTKKVFADVLDKL